MYLDPEHLMRRYSNAANTAVYHAAVNHQRHSAFHRWGRWLLTALLLFFAFSALACFLAFRWLKRRRQNRNLDSSGQQMTSSGIAYQSPSVPPTGAQY